MSDIVQKEDPILRQIALEVPIADIPTPKVQDILKRMGRILSKEDDGVAIAAPQIGESARIFIVSGKLLWYIEHPDEEDAPRKYPEDLVFINPKVVKLSKEKKWVEEGCLSIRYLYGKIRRSTKATIRAYDQNGKRFERGASGVLAQVFQHETDHLDGKLFIDSAKDIEDIPPEAIEKAKRKR